MLAGLSFWYFHYWLQKSKYQLGKLAKSKKNPFVKIRKDLYPGIPHESSFENFREILRKTSVNDFFCVCKLKVHPVTDAFLGNFLKIVGTAISQSSFDRLLSSFDNQVGKNSVTRPQYALRFTFFSSFTVNMTWRFYKVFNCISSLISRLDNYPRVTIFFFLNKNCHCYCEKVYTKI